MKKKKKSSWKKQFLILLLIGAAVFITVQFIQQRQTTNQHASEGEISDITPTQADLPCRSISITSYTTIACTTGGINTINYVCSDGFKGTLGGAACYGEDQMVAFAKNTCESRSTCTDHKSINAPMPTYPTR